MNPIMRRLRREDYYPKVSVLFHSNTDEILEGAFSLIQNAWDNDRFKWMGRKPIAILASAIYISQIQLFLGGVLTVERFVSQWDLAGLFRIGVGTIGRGYRELSEQLGLGFNHDVIRDIVERKLILFNQLKLGDA